MKNLIFAVLAISTTSIFTFADDYSDRRAAQQRQFYDRWEQAGRDIEARAEANVRAGTQKFAARHGGFTQGPTESARDGHWAFGISFTTADGLACSAWQGCTDMPISISCIDANLKNHEFGPNVCNLPRGFGRRK